MNGGAPGDGFAHDRINRAHGAAGREGLIGARAPGVGIARTHLRQKGKHEPAGNAGHFPVIVHPSVFQVAAQERQAGLFQAIHALLARLPRNDAPDVIGKSDVPVESIPSVPGVGIGRRQHGQLGP